LSSRRVKRAPVNAQLVKNPPKVSDHLSNIRPHRLTMRWRAIGRRRAARVSVTRGR